MDGGIFFRILRRNAKILSLSESAMKSILECSHSAISTGTNTLFSKVELMDKIQYKRHLKCKIPEIPICYFH